MKSETRRYSQGARAESAEATGRRILDAFLARLMREWFDEITLDQVAADAGVTVQTVIRRFGGKTGLLGGAVKILGAQVNAQREVASDDVDQAVEKVMGDYERTGEMVLRLLALEERQPVLREFLDFGRAEHRNWVARAFAGLLARLEPATRQKALDALVIATDVYTWKLLRRDMGRSVPEASILMRHLISGAVAEFSKSTPRTKRA